MRVRFWGTRHMWPWCCAWLVVFGAWAAGPVDPLAWGFDPGAAPEVNAAAPGEVTLKNCSANRAPLADLGCPRRHAVQGQHH